MRSRHEQYPSEQAMRELGRALTAEVEEVDVAFRAVLLLPQRPARSSSWVESFNARLRILHPSRRSVSDALLGLRALRGNTSSPRRGSSSARESLANARGGPKEDARG
jgi:hypothetical protein